MAIEIKIPKEVDDYKAKSFMGFNSRQLLCGIVSIGVGTSVFFVFKDSIIPDVLIGLSVISAMPFAFLGFCPNIFGLSPEKLVAIVFRDFFDPQKRRYEELPVFWYVREEIIAEEIEKQKAARRLFRKGQNENNNRKHQITKQRRRRKAENSATD